MENLICENGSKCENPCYHSKPHEKCLDCFEGCCNCDENNESILYHCREATNQEIIAHSYDPKNPICPVCKSTKVMVEQNNNFSTSATMIKKHMLCGECCSKWIELYDYIAITIIT